ncbi:MASE1 domain-containing protein [Gemmatimonas aurantiaca]|uniref:hybrid sensor histidine kinase/response regulator n=1 Tax=Gemmatimonas aurantiaca TaxID=173480 RepID=UPI00301BABBB
MRSGRWIPSPLEPGKLAILALVFFISHAASLALIRYGGPLAPAWPPAGVAVAALLVLPRSHRPLVFIGYVVLDTLSNLLQGYATGVGLMFLVASLSELALIDLLLRRCTDRPLRFARLGEVPLFLAVVSVATAIASVPAGIVAQWADGSTILRGGVVWWIGDMLAYAVVTPLVVLSFYPPRFPIRRWTVARLLEASALAAISMAMAVFAFRGTRLIGPLQAQPYMLILPVLLVTLRFGQLGTLWTVLGIGITGVLLLIDNQPAVLSISAGGDALTIHQTFLGIQAVVALVLSTALREQEETAVEHARTVEALTASEQRLRQSQKMEAIGQLAGGIAHDFNNVLAAILMQLEELRLVRDLPRVGRELLVDVETAVQRAARLTRQLLVFSRQQAMQPRVLDLNVLVRSHVRLLRRVVPSSYSLVVSSAPAPLVVEVDGGMIEQVLMNLVLNARDAQQGGGAIVITMMPRTLPPDSPSGLPPGNYAVLSVRDTGSGIPEDHLPRLFEPFFTTKPTGQGTGLGLATVYGIVQQHGGTVRVETTLGLGTTMEVWLPASTEALPEQATGATDDLSPDSGEHRAPGTILLVEDEPTVQRLLQRVLQREGYQVHVCSSGRDALELWPHIGATIDMVITDLVMPGGVSGTQLARELHRLDPSLPIVFTSGYDPEFDTSDVTMIPGENFVPKPARSEELLSVVRLRLGRREPAAETE